MITMRQAPLAVDTHDLARWLLERTAAWGSRGQGDLARLVTTAACELASDIALALTFPARRREYVDAADLQAVRLRTWLRLAGDSGALPASGLRFATSQLTVIGRMIGGWRKQLGEAPHETTETRG